MARSVGLKRLFALSGLAVGFAFLSPGASVAKPHIQIVATGGTIAGAQPAAGQMGYQSGTFDVQRLIDAAPQMKDLADVTGEQLVNIGSQDMNNEVWLKLAKRVNELVRQPDVDAVVVTHGTDTMEETSYFLGLVIHTKKPIVMVGSMRPATSLGADGPMNLYEAAAVATSPEGRDRGVLVVLNDRIHYAREVEKQNTTALDTFKSPNRGPAGRVEGSAVPSSPGLQRPSEIAAPSRLMISASYRRWRSSTLTRTWGGNLLTWRSRTGRRGSLLPGWATAT